jgi:hypothetical protein
VPNTPELTAANDALVAAERDITDAEAAVRLAQDELREARSRHRLIEGQLLVLNRDSVNAELATLMDAEAAARHALDSFTVPARASEEDIASYKACIDAHSAARAAAWSQLHRARQANGWSWDDQAYTRLSATLENETGDSAERIWYYLQAIHRLDDGPLRQTLAGAVDQIRRYGYGDGHGMPCTSCGEPQTGYDDDYYYCRMCR